MGAPAVLKALVALLALATFESLEYHELGLVGDLAASTGAAATAAAAAVAEIALDDQSTGTPSTAATAAAAAFRCAALLRLVSSDIPGAIGHLRHATAVHAGGELGGCPALQGMYFSSAVTLQRLRLEGAGMRAAEERDGGSTAWRVSCDEHISIAAELEVLGLAKPALAHLDAAASALEWEEAQESGGLAHAPCQASPTALR